MWRTRLMHFLVGSSTGDRTARGLDLGSRLGVPFFRPARLDLGSRLGAPSARQKSLSSFLSRPTLPSTPPPPIGVIHEPPLVLQPLQNKGVSFKGGGFARDSTDPGHQLSVCAAARHHNYINVLPYPVMPRARSNCGGKQ